MRQAVLVSQKNIDKDPNVEDAALVWAFIDAPNDMNGNPIPSIDENEEVYFDNVITGKRLYFYDYTIAEDCINSFGSIMSVAGKVGVATPHMN